MKYTTWTRQEIFDNFIPGFYFVKDPVGKLRVIKLKYGIDNSKIYRAGSGYMYYLAELDKRSILYGPIPTP